MQAKQHKSTSNISIVKLHGKIGLCCAPLQCVSPQARIVLGILYKRIRFPMLELLKALNTWLCNN